MARKDKLYTVNKFNRPAFMPKENIFDTGGGTSNQNGQSQMTGQRTFLGGSNSALNNMMTAPKLSSPSINTNFNMSTASGRAGAIGTSAGLVNNFKSNTSQMLQNQGWSGITNTPSGIGGSSKGAGLAATAKGIADVGINMADSIGKSESNPRGLYDRLDPLHQLAGGAESSFGNGMEDFGVNVFKAGAQSGNGPLMLAGAIAKSIGAGYNALAGIKVDKQKLGAVQENIKANKNYKSDAKDYDDVESVAAHINSSGIYKGRLLSKGRARKKQKAIDESNIESHLLAIRGRDNNYDNISKNQLNDALANYSAFGGPIDFNDRNMGAIEYGFMSDYLDNGRKKIESKNAMNNLFAGVPSSIFADGGGIHIKPSSILEGKKYYKNGGVLEGDYDVEGLSEREIEELYNDGNPAHKKMVVFARNARKFKHADGGPLFAFGGDMATNSSDFSTGLMHIDAGGSHSENPYDGVQLGTDSEGTPNLVEEGEVVFNDYVFSNRINIDTTTKEKFHLPKKKDITYADLAKRLEKEISERPADPISKAGFTAQMQTLEEQQERQKQKMEAQRAKEAFESLSPEEQVAVMQQASEQEAIAQQAAQEQQLAAEQQAAMQQQAQMQADGTEAMLGQEAPMMAEGGHLYADGSKLRKGIYNALGFHTDNDFLEWARKNKLRGDDKWEATEDMFKSLAEDDEAWKALIKDPTFAEAIKDNPALVDAISRGYDFGAYRPSETSGLKYDWDNFWKPVNEYSKQKGNADNKYRIDKTYKEDIKELENSDKYKKFTDYILNNASDEERLNYFKWIDDNTGRSNKYIKDGKLREDWKKAYEDARNDHLYGIQHYTPNPIAFKRGTQAQNWVINDDGSVEEIIGDVPTDWKAAGNYSWATPENDLTYNYYRRPAATATPKTPEEIEAEKKAAKQLERKIVPIHNNTLFGIEDLGPLGAMGLMAAGVGKPDTASLDAAASSAGNVHLADYKPIGDYLTYRPMDIWYEQNALNAQSRATDRALLNSTSPSRMAGLLANSYNSQLASGDLYRKALEYNDAQRERVAGFNRGTNQFNAEAYNRNSQFNAAALNDAVGRSTNARLHAAQTKLDADAGWYNSLYGNLNSINQNIAARRKENRQRNMIADMAAAGIYGVINPDTFNPNSMLRWETDEEYQKRLAQQGKKACGGKMKKGKRGLTF